MLPCKLHCCLYSLNYTETGFLSFMCYLFLPRAIFLHFYLTFPSNIICYIFSLLDVHTSLLVIKGNGYTFREGNSLSVIKGNGYTFRGGNSLSVIKGNGYTFREGNSQQLFLLPF